MLIRIEDGFKGVACEPASLHLLFVKLLNDLLPVSHRASARAPVRAWTTAGSRPRLYSMRKPKNDFHGSVGTTTNQW